MGGAAINHIYCIQQLDYDYNVMYALWREDILQYLHIVHNHNYACIEEGGQQWYILQQKRSRAKGMLILWEGDI